MTSFTPSSHSASPIVQHGYTVHLGGLLAYARADAVFAHSLAHHLRSSWPHMGASATTQPSPYVTPRNREAAIRVATWLIPLLQQATTSDARYARELGSAFAQHYESPKTLIFGVVGVDILGPTLGLIKSKKKKRTAMRLLIADTYYETLTKKQLTSWVTSAAGIQSAQELKTAGGNIYRLHPDTADWCMTDHAVELYTETAQGLLESATILAAEGLSHSSINIGDTLATIVLSPSIDERFVIDRKAAAR